MAQVRQALDGADWVDGRVTAGTQSARAKQNLQLPENAPAARELGDLILAALRRSPLFMSAALPRVYPSSSRATRLTTHRRCNSPACITTCSASGRSSETSP